jgi:hypothetical protein
LHCHMHASIYGHLVTHSFTFHRRIEQFSSSQKRQGHMSQINTTQQ